MSVEVHYEHLDLHAIAAGMPEMREFRKVYCFRRAEKRNQVHQRFAREAYLISSQSSKEID